MLKDKWLKLATGIWILSALGGVIALARGTQITAVVEAVGYPWILLAMLFGRRISGHPPKQRPAIAFAAAVIATALGVGSIFYYSTKHVALTLMTVAIFWDIAADLHAGRNNDFLMTKSIGDIYRYFRTCGQIQRSPVERVLENGSLILMLASVVSLFTITTW